MTNEKSCSASLHGATSARFTVSQRLRSSKRSFSLATISGYGRKQPDQLQLSVRMRVEPQFDCFIALAELDQAEIAIIPVLALLPTGGEVGPVFAGAMIGRARAKIGCEFVRRRQLSPDKAKGKIDREIGEVQLNEFRDQPPGQNQRLHALTTPCTQTETGAKDVGNSTSLAPAPRENLFAAEAYSSAGSSSPSASRSAAPARICSAIRPEFWRIAVSILVLMSGLAFRNAFAFSRPWPRRWLS